MTQDEPLRLWGGHEPTINRIGGRYFDQSVWSGHYLRENDLELFAELGLSALRYPLLWERVRPSPAEAPDWTWADRQFSMMQSLGVRPIAGLVHHGSGPAHTSLLDEDFASGLADHARSAAERYPWIEDWTPVNEPLTTARFSALYGLWHPHARDEPSFWRALLNEIDGVRASMRAIRRTNPGARLIQTEDIGRTYATHPLAYQARFDNARRWMSWDLLCGRVGPDHFMWDRLKEMGLGDRLRVIRDDPCPPDIIGVNHYLTSDRFLDHRWGRYPPERRGGNGAVTYADVEAVRVVVPEPAGLAGVLGEIWERYRIPMAITEVHAGCTREEQLRWFAEAWSAATACRAEGVAVEAVTAWALLGSYNWSSLLCADEGAYEPGAYDVRSPKPRLTAIGHLLREVAQTGRVASPLALQKGWWRREIRLLYPPYLIGAHPKPSVETRPTAPPLLILGSRGSLGRAFGVACALRGLPHILADRRSVDLSDAAAVERTLEVHAPWAVVNAAGYVRVDEAEGDEQACRAVNTEGAARLAQACEAREIRCLNFSTDLVFDGRLERPLVESDEPAPLGAYGRSKAALEQLLRGVEGALTIRTAAFFQAADEFNFAVQAARALARGRRFMAADDLTISPTHVPDLVEACLDLLIDGEQGLWHLANDGQVSWADFACRIATACGLEATLVAPRPWRTLGWRAPRPAYSALSSERGALMPSLEEGVARFARDWEHASVAPICPAAASA